MSTNNELVRKRGAIKAKLTSFTKYFEQFKGNETHDAVEISQLRIRLNDAETLLQEFDTIHEQIITICSDDEVETHYLERDSFGTRYYAVMSSATHELEILTKKDFDNLSVNSDANSQQSVGGIDQLQSIKLPTIQLPKFSGSYDNWLEYKDLFQSLIHTNDSINNVQKFHYLRASLSGAAAQLFHSLEFTATNYEIAWNLICERFNNKRLLVHNHIKAIFEDNKLMTESAKSIRQLIDDVGKYLRALEVLEQPIEYWDTLIIYIVVNKLDSNTMREWEQTKKGEVLPTFEEFKSFLTAKADLLETLEQKASSSNKTQNSKQKYKNASSMLVNTVKCNYCQENHLIYNCKEFLKLNIADRLKKTQELKLCVNCLRTNHTTEQCTLRGCKVCKQKHNSLLHTQLQINNQQVTLSSQDLSQQTMLSTGRVKIACKNGEFINCRAFLDSGSQSNIITYRMCEQLGVDLDKTNISISGIGKVSSKINARCDVTIHSINGLFSTTISCLVIKSISNVIPLEKIDIKQLNIPNNIKLADPLFHIPDTVNLLIGAGPFWDIIGSNKLELRGTWLKLHSSKLGWLVSGQLPSIPKVHCGLTTKNDTELINQLKKFWEVENYDFQNKLSKEDEQCELQFKETVSRNKEGRFIVKLPLKEPISRLGNSYDTALKRMLNLEKKLQTSSIKEQYCEFMQEYLNLGHMTRVDNISESETVYYLPHHGVVKEDSITTKLRVVFDGSSPSDSRWSLNDIQFRGPKIHGDIFSILLRFRQHRYVVSSDITKMYRQIILHHEHRPLHRILWRDNPSNDLSIFELNTVTYGTKAAPYLAIRCINELGFQNKNQFPIASEVIMRDVYVDDMLSGADTIEGAKLICNEVAAILLTAGFKMHKWRSNDSQILESVCSSDQSDKLTLGDSKDYKTLGVEWSSKLDVLSFKISKPNFTIPITKRRILSEIAQIYDPLGLLSPCIILSKIIIQKLWRIQAAWDDTIPENLEFDWRQLREELVNLNCLKISRHAILINYEEIEIHGYCDASQEAYAACIYVKTKSLIENVQVRLLCAKTRVAPLKSLSIPRLELCGALMLARLMQTVKEAMTISAKCHYWTDSQIVLCWLQMESSKLHHL